MTRNVILASALTLLLMMSGAALAEDHNEDMADPTGVDSANEVSEMASPDDALLRDGAVVEDGGVDSANEVDVESPDDASLDEGEVAPDSGVDAASQE
ncbi:hypothetical protein BOX17_16190 [Halomonas aestuarii]|uniref:Uncharacterized protein n=1 Tax=Halomonas aestuarii TaxID=1897729 RepID=A0A1J0VK11_9GAMM|nr:hypothetical protein [Halomonas aestuarii]APE32363.1 hypothetical protein BOX17_16190 [Halomonas aestuarii]